MCVIAHVHVCERTCVCSISQVRPCLKSLPARRLISAAECLEITGKWEQKWEIYKFNTVWRANKDKIENTVTVCVHACQHGYPRLLVCCMNGHTFLTTTAWLYFEIKAPSHNEVCPHKRLSSLHVPWVLLENAISCYLTLHHQTPISISWERMVTELTFLFSHQSEGQRDLCFFIQVKYLSLLQSWYLWWGQEATAVGGKQCSCDVYYKGKKKCYSGDELWHFAHWPFSPWQEPQPIVSHLFSQCVLTYIQRLAWPKRLHA